MWRGRAEIELEGECVEAIKKALLQEVINPPSERRVKVYFQGDKLVIEAEDLRALRASVNSFLYWIHSACETLSQLLTSL